MKLFARFSTKEVDDFAKSLVAYLLKQHPPNKADNKMPKSSTALTDIFRQLNVKVRNFNAERKLGVYKKARLANILKWELKELGYDDSFIKITTDEIIVVLTKK